MIFSRKVYRRRLKKRFLEYFGIEILLSFIVALFYKIGVFPQTRPNIAITTSVVFVANAIFQFFRILRTCLRTRDKAAYYQINLLVFAAFAFVNLWLAYFDKEPLYTFLFLGFKLGTVFDLSKLESALISNLIMLAIVFIVPFRVIDDEDLPEPDDLDESEETEEENTNGPENSVKNEKAEIV